MRFNRLVRLGSGLALFLALGATSASAQDGGSCDSWLPDFNCDRSGRWDGFHHPIVSFPLFEDPFITTGIYPYYAWHEFPGRSALQGGDAHDVSVQARIALTDRLAFIATKDGYMWKNPDNPLLDDTEGFLNIAGGFKYALVQDQEAGYIVTGVLRVEVDTGSSDTFQGWGDGMVLPSITGAWGSGPLHIMADVGAQIPFDGNDQSTSIFYHLYADYNVTEHFAPFVQLSGLTWVSSGNGEIPVKLKRGIVPGSELTLDVAQSALGTGAFEGADLMNLGSRGVNGLSLWTWAVGAHIPITDHVTFSFAYERPFSHHKGIFGQRVTTGLTLEF
ncbi:MAG: hypothetical protein JRH01_01750 [Deltaproteobacteria bacterium]|nr:hypothetical protein [Deltaproteobacteria bacterium]MBW2394665.1 hypothetical protein [Deltaproteobacteria bacterium]